MVGRPRLVKAGDPAAAGQHLTGSVQALDRGLNLLAIIAEADGLPLTSIADFISARFAKSMPTSNVPTHN